ncbi:hypothetical protein Desca_0937 [Desulfotomaculum nigrificans CO-1-SRB]|uniref:Lipoprotein n=1 Tax=Desulfotomaculum nigrificans (strain DSM 14880 / VKM B-2319 / CO-1-SRB) TaxID=868595 RepID=F6B9W5_DESCC|nr:hypothetical protein [Desulfotomaculum nigrificans]AEF93813.1 hypothetical protein Desca_0937 [Desulfotomaculum nigrificans CO-1-SRB]
MQKKVKIVTCLALALPTLIIVLASCLSMVLLSCTGWLLGKRSPKRTGNPQPVNVKGAKIVYMHVYKNKKAA